MTGPQELTALVEGYLDELALTPELGELAGPIRYALAGGGKRIRPVLCLATGEALGREPEELLPAGAAIELVHNFSLVHDDLPSLDDDELPRGRPSTWAQFDEATAVLERGKVVVDEREIVDEFDRGAGREELLGLAPQRLPGCKAEHRPDPLAAACKCVANRPGELAEFRRQRQLVEVALDQGCQLLRARHPASFFARASSTSTSFAISASSERISIARSGSCVDSSS